MCVLRLLLCLLSNNITMKCYYISVCTVCTMIKFLYIVESKKKILLYTLLALVFQDLFTQDGVLLKACIGRPVTDLNSIGMLCIVVNPDGSKGIEWRPNDLITIESDTQDQEWAVVNTIGKQIFILIFFIIFWPACIVADKLITCSWLHDNCLFIMSWFSALDGLKLYRTSGKRMPKKNFVLHCVVWNWCELNVAIAVLRTVWWDEFIWHNIAIILVSTYFRMYLFVNTFNLQRIVNLVVISQNLSNDNQLI